MMLYDVMILSSGSVILTRIALYVRVDKENSLESLLDCVHYLYMSDCLSLFTDPTILHNQIKEKETRKININLEGIGRFMTITNGHLLICDC